MECRICFEGDDVEPFCTPCGCKGTSAFVHRSCLNKWRAKASNRRAYSICMECRQPYTLSCSERVWVLVLAFTHTYLVVLYGPLLVFGIYFVLNQYVDDVGWHLVGAFTPLLFSWLYTCRVRLISCTEATFQLWFFGIVALAGFYINVNIALIICSCFLSFQLLTIKLVTPTTTQRSLEEEPLLVQNA